MEKAMAQTVAIRSVMTPRLFSDPSQTYLVGVRGFLVIQSFLWVFLRTFVPTAVKDSQNPHGPLYQEIIRKTLSVLFWNETLIYSAIIFLSARTVAIPFLQSKNRTVAASAIFRRGIRLWFPVAIALAIIKLVFTFYSISPTSIATFAEKTGNESLDTPYQLPNTLAYFNSVFNIFWVTRSFDQQAASLAFPSQTLWIISVIFEQSYTVYMTMIIIPYVRPTARLVFGFAFVATAWWVDSWAFYTITGLLLADAVMNMSFMQHSKAGLPIGLLLPDKDRFKRYRNVAVPSWILYAVLMIAGLIMQYLWTDWRPDLEDQELKVHTGLYYSGGLNDTIKPGQPLARDDNYLYLLGFFLFLESTQWMQIVFRNPLFMYLGKRSLSWFLIQSTIVYTAGIALFSHLHLSQNVPFVGAIIACLLVCLLTVSASGEIFYRFVDLPSQKLAFASFDWITR